MEDATRTQIILAAVTSAGPVVDGDVAGWNATVERQAARISVLVSAKGDIAKTLDAIENASIYTATVVSVTKEASSTRGLVQLKTKPSTNYPDGIEPIRTERTDSPSGLGMAKAMRSLIGHKVVIWKEIQKYDGGTVRIVRHVEDLGVDPEFAAQTA